MRDWDTFGILRVGASITIGSQFLPNYVKAFYARHPGTEIRPSSSPRTGWRRRFSAATWIWR